MRQTPIQGEFANCCFSVGVDIVAAKLLLGIATAVVMPYVNLIQHTDDSMCCMDDTTCIYLLHRKQPGFYSMHVDCMI